MDDEAAGPASNKRYTNRYVISKSKPSCGELLEGVEFTTVVHQKTNATKTFKLGWDAVSDDLIDL